MLRFLAFVVLPTIALAQTELPPVPADPLELVTGPAQTVADAQQRLDAISLLNNAHELSNIRAQPYDLKTSFVSPDGRWSLEDTSPARKIYRWTADGPNYSAVNLYTDSTEGMLYSNQPGGSIPLRLAQVRNAIFFTYPAIGPQASVRTATGLLNGVAQRCVLVLQGAIGRTLTGPRNWDESEFCVDSNTGLLTTYSPAPGLFVHYDYSSGVKFHGKSIPGAVTITEGGRDVIEATTVSVADPIDPKSAVFASAGLNPVGVGRGMTPSAHMRGSVRLPSGSSPQVAVLHGSLSADGRVSEVELLASSDPSVNQAALNRVAASHGPFLGQGQPGATPQSREMFFTFEFVPPIR